MFRTYYRQLLAARRLISIGKHHSSKHRGSDSSNSSLLQHSRYLRWKTYWLPLFEVNMVYDIELLSALSAIRKESLQAQYQITTIEDLIRTLTWLHYTLHVGNRNTSLFSSKILKLLYDFLVTTLSTRHVLVANQL